MVKKRILVFYAPGGNGHKSAAKMLKETFARKYPEHEVIVDNVLDIANPFLKFSLNVYDNLLKIDPRLVKYGFNLLNAIKSDKALSKAFPKIISILKRRIEEIKPDLVVSVHSAINNFLIEAVKNTGRKIPFVIVCTDLTDKFLTGWVHPEADLMVAFLEESKRQMMEFGIPEEKILVLGGPPVNPLFSDNTLSKSEARRKFGLQDDIFTVLIMSGGVGLKTVYTFTKQLVNSSLPVQILVVCGKNETLKEKVENLVKDKKKNVKVFGFTDQVHNMMDAADVIVTKPGPGVIAEAIVKELPIVLDGLSEVMPQEAGNVSYVLNNGVGKKVSEISKFHNHIASIMYNEEELPKMRGNMKRLRKTESSGKLADWLLRIANEGTAELLIKEEQQLSSDNQFISNH